NLNSEKNEDNRKRSDELEKSEEVTSICDGSLPAFLLLDSCCSQARSYLVSLFFWPLWLFHVVVARGRFSLPAAAMPHDRHWAPFHAVIAMPLLVAFELLLAMHLGSSYTVNLKIVFLPLLALEGAILFDNIRMCKALIPGDDENMNDEAIWETLPHFWVTISTLFFIAATIFTVLKLTGDVAALGWWDIFIDFGIAECFAFLVCTKWHNPAIHRHSQIRETGSSSTAVRYLNWNSGLLVSLIENQHWSRICSLQDIGGHIMKIPLISFQILLFMHLEGTPSPARHMPYSVIFAPILLLQGAGVLFSVYRLVEKIVLLLHGGGGSERYFTISSTGRDCFGFLHHGSRCNTFSPDGVKKMPKKELAEEVWRLQVALIEQLEITKYRRQEYERLQNEKVLCKVCFDEQINMVLLPCRHHNLCSVQSAVSPLKSACQFLMDSLC
ncbi:Transmembrane Fragile-X-F-associated protein, partial [Dillenia turbinata]